jgi:hypothetical protein
MNKNILIKSISLVSYFFTLLCWASVPYAQQSSKIEWQHCYGGSKIDGFNPLGSHMIVQTFDGGYIFVAESESNDGDVSGNHGSGIGKNTTYDFWLVKVNSAGNIQWQKSFGGSDHDDPCCIIQSSDHGYVLSGSSRSHDGDVVGNHTGATFGVVDAWVIKTDSAGRLEWTKCFGCNNGNEVFNSIVQTTDGGYIAAGSSSSFDEDCSTHGIGIDAFVAKLNPLGDLVWSRFYGGSYAEEAYSIIQTSNGEYLFTGKAQSSDGDVVGHRVPDPPLNPATSRDLWVVQIDSNGSIVWSKCYGGAKDEEGHCIINTLDGGYAIGGWADSADKDVIGIHGSSDGWILKIDSLGVIQWQKCIGGSRADNISCILQTLKGDYTFAGNTISLDGDVTGLHKGIIDSADGWVGILSATGDLEWQKCFGGTGEDGLFSIALTSDNGFVAEGKTESNNGDVSGNHGKSDIWVVKLTAPTNHVQEVTNSPGLYPNPSSNEMTVKMYDCTIKEIQFFNFAGKQYYPEYRLKDNDAIVDVHTLPSGMYLAKTIYLSQGYILQDEIHKFLKQ